MMMRSFIFLFILSLAMKSATAQTLTAEEKAKYIGYLDSTDTALILEGLSEIEKYQITEALPALERNIWKQWPDYQYFFLKTMWRLHSTNTIAFAKAFIDTSDTFRFKNTPALTDSLKAKVDATEILIDLGDYSTVPFVFEILKRDSNSFYSNAVYLLKSIILRVPAYAESARNALIKIVLHDSHDQIRWVAFSDLVELYGAQVNDVLLQVAVNDPQSDNRVSALRKLIALGYSQIKQLLYERLYNESATYRTFIVDTLLVRYGTAQDYKVVKEYQVWEQDSINKSLTGYLLFLFKPPVPSLSTPVLVMLDSLISYKHQVAALGWLGDEHFVKELDNDLENAQKHLAKGDSVNTAKEVEKFQDKVKKEYERIIDNEKKNKPRDKRFVTEEGYKFLYYNAKYIIDRLPGKK